MSQKSPNELMVLPGFTAQNSLYDARKASQWLTSRDSLLSTLVIPSFDGDDDEERGGRSRCMRRCMRDARDDCEDECDFGNF
jgi:hypothetical protein